MLRSRASSLLVATTLGLLGVIGCGAHDDKQDAARVLDHHFDALAHERYDAALADYDDRFFIDTTRAEWRNALASVTAKIGRVQRYDVTVDGIEGKQTAGPGTYLKFKCKVTYAKHTSEETFYLFRREGATQFRILGHEIDSKGLVGS
jgi:hypothetical protein